MSTKNPQDAFESIDPTTLEAVSGGATRVSGKGGDAELTAMLTSIGDSIKDLANQKNNSGGDTMQLMMMMLMMGGFGGGGGGGIAAPAQTPVINVDTGIVGGCRKKGKKGW